MGFRGWILQFSLPVDMSLRSRLVGAIPAGVDGHGLTDVEPDREAVLALLGGTAEQISNELAEFAASARVLSQDSPRFIDEYPEKRVAVYRGQVAASGGSLEEASTPERPASC